MNKTQAKKKLKENEILLHVRHNFAKFIPAFKYAPTKEEFKKQTECFFPFEMEEKDWDFFLNLSLSQIVSFVADIEIVNEIQKCWEVISQPEKKKGRKKNEKSLHLDL